MAARSPDWLLATVSAVRDLMLTRLEAQSLNPDAKRETERALEELDVMWEELQGQAATLLRENERYAELFEYSPDAYVITDVAGNVREANQAALELFAARRGDVVGHPLSAQLQPADRAPLAVELSVRAIRLKKSGAGGLCWLIRPAA